MNPRSASARFIYDIKAWPKVRPEHIPPEKIESFNARRDAILAHHNGDSYRVIQKDFGIAPKELNRFIERCQVLHRDGEIWGFRALIDRTIFKEAKRKTEPDLAKLKKGQGAKALFGKLLDDYKELAALLETHAHKVVAAAASGRRVRVADLHLDFVAACRVALKNDHSKYPLCLTHRGSERMIVVVKIRDRRKLVLLALVGIAHSAFFLDRSTGNKAPSLLTCGDCVGLADFFGGLARLAGALAGFACILAASVAAARSSVARLARCSVTCRRGSRCGSNLNRFVRISRFRILRRRRS